MTDMLKLKGKIVENGLTREEFAKKIGMNPSTFYRKLNAEGLAFTIGEMHKIVDVLNITADEATTIFLGYNSQ